MKKRQHGFNEKCFVVEYHGANRATFQCSAIGHTFRGNLMRRAPNGKLPSEDMLRKMAHWWGRHNVEGKSGGCYMPCPKCRAPRS